MSKERERKDLGSRTVFRERQPLVRNVEVDADDISGGERRTVLAIYYSVAPYSSASLV